MGKITGRIEMIHQIIHHTDTIFEASLPVGHPQQQKLSRAIQSNCMAIVLLRSHYLLSDVEIERFQEHADDFLSNWIEVFDVEGVTTYIGKVQAVTHLNTQRGGGGWG